MAWAPFVASVVVLLPALALLWFYLRRYEGYFDQGAIFFALLAGMVAGVVVRWLEFNLFPFEDPSRFGMDRPYSSGVITYYLAYTAVGYAMIETLGKSVLLGLRRFRTRKDAPYHGAALGLGFAALWGSSVMGYQIGPSFEALRAPYLAALFVLLMGALGAHGASGVWVGKGSADGRLWRGVMVGTLWLVPALAAYAYFLLGRQQLLAAGAGLLWGAFALVYADRKVLQVIVPPEIRDMVRRERRREMRRKDPEA